MHAGRLATIGWAIAALASASAPAAAEPLEGAYRGMIVCEKLTTARLMLRAPFDIVITGKTAVAARPIFNLNGTRVIGSEIATGAVADDGSIKLSSNWKSGGASYQGNYGGTLNEKGGTLTGTQAWSMPQGQQTRNCTLAVVQTKS